MSIPGQVRRSCNAVVERAQLVAIDQGRLEQVAATVSALLPEAGLQPDDEHRHGHGHEPLDEAGLERSVGLVLGLNAVNFGSGFHDIVTKEPGLSGARSMATRFERFWSESGAEPSTLFGLDATSCAAVFGQSPDNTEQMDLMRLFAAALGDLGQLVDTRYDGSFAAVVEAADHSASRLAQQLLAMPFYRDRQSLDDHEVCFYKRAQIAAADLSRSLGRWAPARFDDLDQLTAFADNLVPHVLRVDGALRYSADLSATIDRGQPLEHGSPAEIEIRALGVVAVEQLTDRLRPEYPGVRAMDVDLALWNLGGEPRYKAIPRHRSRCVFY